MFDGTPNSVITFERTGFSKENVDVVYEHELWAKVEVRGGGTNRKVLKKTLTFKLLTLTETEKVLPRTRALKFLIYFFSVYIYLQKWNDMMNERVIH